MDLSYFLSTNCRHYDAATLAISVFAFVTLRVRLETRRAGMRALDAEPGKSLSPLRGSEPSEPFTVRSQRRARTSRTITSVRSSEGKSCWVIRDDS